MHLRQDAGREREIVFADEAERGDYRLVRPYAAGETNFAASGHRGESRLDRVEATLEV
jgi:hypothetical protein